MNIDKEMQEARARLHAYIDKLAEKALREIRRNLHFTARSNGQKRRRAREKGDK